MNPSAQDVVLGNQVSVALVISGLTDLGPPALGSFDIDVLFDPAILSFGRATYGDPSLGDQLDPTGLAGIVTSTTPGVGVGESVRAITRRSGLVERPAARPPNRSARGLLPLPGSSR